ELAPAVGVRVTTVLLAKLAVHAPPQSMPTGKLVTVPVPAPILLMVRLKSGITNGLIVKLASEMSKKMLPTASILIRAVGVEMLGSVTASTPSLGVLVFRTTENVLPLSVESRMLTLAVLTGALVV